MLLKETHRDPDIAQGSEAGEFSRRLQTGPAQTALERPQTPPPVTELLPVLAGSCEKVAGGEKAPALQRLSKLQC